MNLPERPDLDPAQRLRWPLPVALLPFFGVWLGWSWWREIHTQLVHGGVATSAIGPGVLASVALGARVLGTLSEAGGYVLWWRSRSLRLPYWRFAAWVAALSSADLFGFALHRATAESSEPLRLVAAVIAGPGGAERPPGGSGALVAFANAGALTALRVVGTAWAQARGIGRPLARPLLITAVAWLLTRLTAWWSLDLVTGMSPVP